MGYRPNPFRQRMSERATSDQEFVKHWVCCETTPPEVRKLRIRSARWLCHRLSDGGHVDQDHIATARADDFISRARPRAFGVASAWPTGASPPPT